MGSDHHTKTDEVEEAWGTPVAGSRTRQLIGADERAAALNTVTGNIFILSTIIRPIRITPE